jgi:pimeloyl-ACP methyl ester carboxylesterase
MPVRRRLVTFPASDGELHDGLLTLDRAALRDRVRRTGRRTAVLHAHGNQGNFLVGSLRFLPEPLAQAGLPVLNVDTRLANCAQIFGEARFADALHDLAGASGWLAAEGFDSVVISGYSLGAILATRFAGDTGEPPPWSPLHLRGLMAIGNAIGLPQSTERRMRVHGARPTYPELVTRARVAVGVDDGGEHPDTVVVVERAFGDEDAPRRAAVYTLRGFWTSRSPEATDAMPVHHVRTVPGPILLVEGDADVVVLPGEAEALAESARQAGNDDVTVATVPGAGHSFAGHEAEVVGHALEWLEERG